MFEIEDQRGSGEDEQKKNEAVDENKSCCRFSKSMCRMHSLAFIESFRRHTFSTYFTHAKVTVSCVCVCLCFRLFVRLLKNP
jgi:hypothetical protein